MERGVLKCSILNHGAIPVSKGMGLEISFKGFKNHPLGKIREIIGKRGIIQVLHRYSVKV